MNRIKRAFKLIYIFAMMFLVMGSAIGGLVASLAHEPTWMYLIIPTLFFIDVIRVLSKEDPVKDTIVLGQSEILIQAEKGESVEILKSPHVNTHTKGNK